MLFGWSLIFWHFSLRMRDEYKTLTLYACVCVVPVKIKQHISGLGKLNRIRMWQK